MIQQESERVFPVPVKQALSVFNEQIDSVEALNDYLCILSYRKSGDAKENKVISLRLRRNPLSTHGYYWRPTDSDKRELILHDGAGDRHLSQLDLLSVIQKMSSELQSAAAGLQKCTMVVSEGAAVNGRSCTFLEIQCFSKSSNVVDIFRLLTYVDLRIPAYVTHFRKSDGEQQTVWEYAYHQIQTDIGLTDKDFGMLPMN